MVEFCRANKFFFNLKILHTHLKNQKTEVNLTQMKLKDKLQA